VTLTADAVPVAAAVVLRHQDRAFYFKLGVDERFSKFSPGVQLTLELTGISAPIRRLRPPIPPPTPIIHDQSDLARTSHDRRRPDSAAAK